MFLRNIKTLKSWYNIVFSKKSPIALIHFVTNRCNARCPFCFIDFNNEDTQSKKHELSLEEISRLTKKLGPTIQHVNLTGGEPFLRPDLLDIARLYIKNANLSSILVNTNGSNPKKIEEFTGKISEEFPYVKIHICLSIDSFKDKHDKIRRIPGLFEKAISAYRLLSEVEGEIYPVVNITVTEENHDDVVELYHELYNTHQVRSFSVTIARDEGIYKVDPKKKALILEAYLKLSSLISKHSSKGSLRENILHSKSELQFKIISKLYMEPKFVSNCRAGSIFGVISTSGKVLSCEILEKEIGDLRKANMSLIKIWNSKKANEARKWIRDNKCHCHWENIWTYNILSTVKYQTQIFFKLVFSALKW